MWIFSEALQEEQGLAPGSDAWYVVTVNAAGSAFTPLRGTWQLRLVPPMVWAYR